MASALILGINGQDGSYLAEILLYKGYEVHGLIRRTATGNTKNIAHIEDRIHLHYGDLTDPISIYKVISDVRPREIYNEADQDHAGLSFKIPAYNFDVTGSAVGRILETILQIDRTIRYFQPVTSNMFGQAGDCPQNENTRFNPMNPYSCAKAFAYHLCHMYRTAYDMHVSVAIFYNHESPRRTEHYVTRKITRSVARIKAGLQENLVLGDTSALIDWGYAREYMEAAWQMVQLDKPETLIIGTGEVHSVMAFAEEAFSYAGLDVARHLKSSQSLFRPAQNSVLQADISRANEVMGFRPKIKYGDLVKIMMDHDLEDMHIENGRKANPGLSGRAKNGYSKNSWLEIALSGHTPSSIGQRSHVSSLRKIVKELIHSAGFDLHRLNPYSNSSFQILKALNRFEVDLVLDVGANIGQFASELLSMGYRGSLVSFEPLSDAHLELLNAARKEPRWRVHPRCAIGDHDGEIHFNIAGNSVSSSILPMMDAHSSAAVGSAFVGVEKVPLFRIDSVAPAYLAGARRPLLKIDTQGFEWQVLDGASETLPKLQGVLCELSLVPLYQGQRLWMDVIDRLEKAGFVLWSIQRGFTDPRDGRTLQVDAAFFRPELAAQL